MLKVGQKVKFKSEFLSSRPAQDNSENIENKYEILSVDSAGYGYIYRTNNTRGIFGFSNGDTCWRVIEQHLDIIEEEKPKEEKFEIDYDEPIEDEMDDDCVEGCRPGEHNCGKKIVQICLIEIGRNKVNEVIQIPLKNRTEEQLAEVALERCKDYLKSSEVELHPDEVKGQGWWKVKVGMGYTVGYIQIKLW